MLTHEPSITQFRPFHAGAYGRDLTHADLVEEQKNNPKATFIIPDNTSDQKYANSPSQKHWRRGIGGLAGVMLPVEIGPANSGIYDISTMGIASGSYDLRDDKLDIPVGNTKKTIRQIIKQNIAYAFELLAQGRELYIPFMEHERRGFVPAFATGGIFNNPNISQFIQEELEKVRLFCTNPDNLPLEQRLNNFLSEDKEYQEGWERGSSKKTFIEPNPHALKTIPTPSATSKAKPMGFWRSSWREKAKWFLRLSIPAIAIGGVFFPPLLTLLCVPSILLTIQNAWQQKSITAVTLFLTVGIIAAVLGLPFLADINLATPALKIFSAFKELGSIVSYVIVGLNVLATSLLVSRVFSWRANQYQSYKLISSEKQQTLIITAEPTPQTVVEATSSLQAEEKAAAQQVVAATTVQAPKSNSRVNLVPAVIAFYISKMGTAKAIDYINTLKQYANYEALQEENVGATVLLNDRRRGTQETIPLPESVKNKTLSMIEQELRAALNIAANIAHECKPDSSESTPLLPLPAVVAFYISSMDTAKAIDYINKIKQNDNYEALQKENVGATVLSFNRRTGTRETIDLPESVKNKTLSTIEQELRAIAERNNHTDSSASIPLSPPDNKVSASTSATDIPRSNMQTQTTTVAIPATIFTGTGTGTNTTEQTNTVAGANINISEQTNLPPTSLAPAPTTQIHN